MTIGLVCEFVKRRRRKKKREKGAGVMDRSNWDLYVLFFFLSFLLRDIC